MQIQELYNKMRKSPRYFVRVMWGLVPQTKGEPFIKGKHITWQQNEMLEAVERALKGIAPKRIAAKSGHGVGKSTVMAWLILWFLFCHAHAQVPCTAPTADQLSDILWKEIKRWLDRMKPEIAGLYDYTNDHVRMKESPQTWFARARTGRKESPEALAGVHGDYILYVVDEGSGIPEEVFQTAEGALTQENILFIMFSNPTRLTGYFYDAFHADKDAWQNLTFNSQDSPIVESDYCDRIATKYGADSEEYKIRVLGEFPKAEGMDSKGFVPLLVATDLHYATLHDFIGPRRMGIDPAGEGKDKTVWVVRDQFKARIVGEEQTSNEKSIAQKTLTLMDHYEIYPEMITVENFGCGANVAQELALHRVKVLAVQTGDAPPSDPDRFVNMKAWAYDELKKWIRQGGELVPNPAWEELLHIRYMRTLKNKMQIMSKKMMKKEGFKSPDHADALMLTFLTGRQIVQFFPGQQKKVRSAPIDNGF